MADVVVTPIKLDKDGAAEAFVAVATGNTYKVRNNGRTVLHFKKTGAGAANITIETPKTLRGYAVADQVVIVPATTGDILMAPTDRDLFNDPSQDVNFTTDEGTGLTVAAFYI